MNRECVGAFVLASLVACDGREGQNDSGSAIELRRAIAAPSCWTQPPESIRSEAEHQLMNFKLGVEAQWAQALRGLITDDPTASSWSKVLDSPAGRDDLRFW